MGFLLAQFPKQDVFYGIAQENIASQLTTENWSQFAVIRVEISDPTLWHYLWIRDFSRGEDYQYSVQDFSPESTTDYGAAFKSLAEALMYINGEDHLSTLAQETRTPTLAEYPPNMSPTAQVQAAK